MGVVSRIADRERFVAELLPPALQGRARSDGAHAFRERAQADRQRGFLVRQVDDGDCRQYVVYLVIARKVQFQVENFVVAVALDAEFLEIPFRRMVDAREIVFGIDDFGHHGRCRLVEDVVVFVALLADHDRDAF